MHGDQILRGFGVDPSVLDTSPRPSKARRAQLRKRARSINVYHAQMIQRVLEIVDLTANFKGSVDQIMEASGMRELEVALNLGAVTLDSSGFSISDDEPGTAYDVALTQLLCDKRYYPMFDPVISQRVRRLAAENPSPHHDFSRKRSRRASVGTGMIERLPVFPDAPIELILEARAELTSELTLYRTATKDLVQKMSFEQYEHNASTAELDDLYNDTIMPAIVRLQRELAKTPLAVAAYQEVTDKWKQITTISAGVSGGSITLGGFDIGVAIAACTFAGTAAVSVGARRAIDRREQIKAARSDNFYYLLDLSERLV